MTITASESTMRKISSLLELAAHPETPENERARARELADSLMAKHKIERATFSWEKPIAERRKPIVRYFRRITTVRVEAMASNRDSVEWSIQERIRGLQSAAFRFAGVRARGKYLSKEEAKEVGFGDIEMVYVVAGYDEDIYYGELVWNMILTEIVRGLYPGWDQKRSMDENVFLLKDAGYSWSAIRAFGLSNNAKDHNGALTEKNAGSKLRTAYKREAKRRGLPAELPKLNDPQHWRNSWISGFESNILQEMSAIKRGRESFFEGQNLPAIAQEEDAIKDLWEEMFPPPPPPTPLTEEEKEELKRLDEEAKKRKPKAVRIRQPRRREADLGAWRSGVSASKRVELQSDAKLKNKKEIS